MLLGEMNWLDFDAVEKESLVAVYAIASFEQHGHHLPFLTDTMETDEIVRRLDARLTDEVVCLPTQWLGYSHHHSRFAGSMTASSDTHINLVAETIGCLIAAGLTKVLVINGHGGNRANLRVALQKVKEGYPDASVYGTDWWDVAGARMEELKEAGPGGSGHGGETETSMMLAIRPDLVKTARLQRDGRRPVSEYARRVMQFRRLDERTERGVMGDPTMATAEKGERMMQAMVDSLVEVVADIQSGRLDA